MLWMEILGFAAALPTGSGLLLAHGRVWLEYTHSSPRVRDSE